MSFGAGAEVWAAGVAAGLTGDVFVHPMETIITRVQSPAYTTRYKSIDGRLKGTLFRGLYQGFGPTLVAGIPSSAAFFAVYEGMKGAFQDMQADGYLQELPPSAIHVASSGAAELVHCAISNPAEVLKQNAQVQQGSATPKPLGWYTLQVFRGFARHPSKLWTGYSALLASNLPGTCITFGLYEHIKERLLNSLSKNGQQATVLMQVQVSALSAGLAGGFTSCFLVPIDVIKTRMRLAAGEHSDTETPLGKPKRSPPLISFWDVARETFRAEGVPGFFRGFTLTCVAATVGSGLYLGCYEGVKLYMKGLDGELEERIKS
ncbi:hypothetical protein FDECE_6796 [Fusarium decemcellulare]|nr:hypothetical protein FDECE_6796 [Fusarium decemcellulare]